MVGTALGASLMAAVVFDNQSVMAADTCNGAAFSSPITFGSQPNGINCTTAVDLTVISNGTSVGGNKAPNPQPGDGSGIEITATGTGPGLKIGVNNSAGIGTNAADQPVTANGIEVALSDTILGTLVDAVTITNTGPIGLAGPCRSVRHYCDIKFLRRF